MCRQAEMYRTSSIYGVSKSFAERSRYELEGRQFIKDAGLTVVLYDVGGALYVLPLKNEQETKINKSRREYVVM